MHFSLSYSGTSLDFSTYITNWQFSVTPSFDWNDLLNGKIAPTYDLGYSVDKYYSQIELTLPFNIYQSFISFFKASKGQALTIASDFDLFFPNVYNITSGIITEIKDSGYLGSDITTGYRVITVKLYSPTIPTYTISTTIPAILSNGIWKQDYTFSDKVNVVENGLRLDYSIFTNDSNNWTVDFNYLSRDQANSLLSWILSVRTSIATITTNSRQANTSNVVGDSTKTSTYNIKSFSFSNEKTYYTATLDLVERANK